MGRKTSGLPVLVRQVIGGHDRFEQLVTGVGDVFDREPRDKPECTNG